MTHTAILLSVQANLLNLTSIGAVTSVHIPDQFNATIWEVRCLAERGSLPSKHCHWHTLKFERERTEAQIERQALHEWLCDSVLVTDRDVKAPPMVGPTWTRVRFALGSDCSPLLFQGTALLCFLLYAFLVDCSRMTNVR